MLKLNTLALCALALLPIALTAQTPAPSAVQTRTANDHRGDEVAIQQVMNSYHAAIFAHDGTAFSSLFLPDANLWLDVLTDSAYARAQAKSATAQKIHVSNYLDFAKLVSSKTKNFDPEHSNLVIHTDGTIAVVYFDFVFNVDGKANNRGSETWQLVKAADGWRIASIVYSSEPPVDELGQTAPSTPHATASPSVHELRSHPDWPAATPSDVQSPRSIVAAFFSTISAPSGGTVDRMRLQSLLVPDGRIELPLPGAGGQPTDVVFVTPDGYAAMSDAGTTNEGFFDYAIAMTVEQFGVMAHVYASYESRKSQSDPAPFVRGVKSFELLNSGGRWYITQVAWDREREDNPIPNIYPQDRSR